MGHVEIAAMPFLPASSLPPTPYRPCLAGVVRIPWLERALLCHARSVHVPVVSAGEHGMP